MYLETSTDGRPFFWGHVYPFLPKWTQMMASSLFLNTYSDTLPYPPLSSSFFLMGKNRCAGEDQGYCVGDGKGLLPFLLTCKLSEQTQPNPSTDEWPYLIVLSSLLPCLATRGQSALLRAATGLGLCSVLLYPALQPRPQCLSCSGLSLPSGLSF